MRKATLILAAFIITSTATAQFSDNFNDGDFLDNPTWQAAAGDFVVNTNGQLQSNNGTASSAFSITTANTSLAGTEWEFWIRLDFNPSSANYVDVWLTSQLQDLGNNANSGYFARIGSTDDDICLYKKLPGVAPLKIIDGINGLLNSSSNTVKIKVIRTGSGKWILLRDVSGTGSAFRSEGEVSDNSITGSNHFGIYIRQSTASFFNKHFFDDFVVKSFDEVTTAPAVVAVTAPAASTVKIAFDRPVNILSAEDISHYFISGIGNPLSATVDASNGSIVLLHFESAFAPNEKKSLLINDVSDVYGNSIINALKDFYFYKAVRYDVVIDEIFADPSPQLGLPTQKFIELKNNATFSVNVKNWKLTDGNSVAYLPDADILPDSFLIITTSSGLDAYKAFGKTVAVSNFPSLYVTGSDVALYDNNGTAMHAMSYDISTYRNDLKKEGGFSLEMINTQTGCVQHQNWIASNDASGGTPGRRNSVDEPKIFDQNFEVTNAFLSAPDTLYVVINKAADSAAAAIKDHYVVDGGLVISGVEVLAPFFNTIRITFASPAVAEKVYTIKVNALTGCDGAGISNVRNSARFALPAEAAINDIVINELLFDPKPDGVDYLELYNKSSKAIDLKNIFIANRNATGEPANFVQASTQSKLLLPGTFALLTTDPLITALHFPAGDQDVFIKTASLPSFPNDRGTAIVTNRQGDILDEIRYSEKWHFPLIKDREGISLERILYDSPSDQTNFHSASTAVNGTPGYKNSQSAPGDNNGGTFGLSPEIFSPDNDGTDDFLTISYAFPSQGYVTNIKIFDASGQMVRYLEKNSLSSTKGYYRWDGLDDKSRKLPQGIYIIYFESFNESGKKMIHRKSVVLARRW